MATYFLEENIHLLRMKKFNCQTQSAMNSKSQIINYELNIKVKLFTFLIKYYVGSFGEF